jgi:energy-coupling factor transporter ATP-binding protein EcfA2
VRPLVEACDAAFRYPARDAAVGPFSLAVHAGELHHIRGPSGCGKSTLGRMLAGLIPHLYRGQFGGAVRVGNWLTTDAPLWQLSTHVGFVGQNPAAQLLGATVRDEILFGLENLGLSRAEMRTRLRAALDASGLGGLAERDPHTLSGGEQQKLVLAAVAARQPQVLVLDEALSMLDETSAGDIAQHVQRLRHAGTAVIAFEHRAPVEAWREDARCRTLAGAPAALSPLPDLPPQIAPLQLSVRGLGVRLSGQEVLNGIDLSLTGGRVVALLGANGAGKTTLLRALAGLEPHSGNIGDDAGGVPRIGLCFQNSDQQIFNPTVRAEILFGNPEADEGFFRCVIELLGLAPYEHTPPLLLSEGEKKRLSLAILLTRPGLRGVCLDEPTLGQDDLYQHRIGRVLRRLAAAGYLCVVATHDVAWAAKWCDEFVLLHAGQIAGHQRATAVRPPQRSEGRCPAVA